VHDVDVEGGGGLYVNVVFEGFVEHEFEVGALGAIAIIVFSLVIVILKGGSEPGFGSLYVFGDLGQISELEGRTVFPDQSHEVYPVKSQFILLQRIFLLGEIIGLIDKIYVLGFHFFCR
jgi:hypothetical protein